jgi:5-hydroxyisourate hydrolase-like protein (transthyretin family)
MELFSSSFKVLDTQFGKPAINVAVSLSRLTDGNALELATGYVLY